MPVDSTHGVVAESLFARAYRLPTSKFLMHWVHFYPFSTAGDHGGTLRLRTAELACSRLGDQQTFWFDHASARWRDDSASPPHGDQTSPLGFKRRIFPSTLYESGRGAIEAFRNIDWSTRLPASANAIFHTTYLGPLLKDERPAWLNRAVIDVYDLVWRAHAIDAHLVGGPVRLARSTYSELVKRRETRAISRADAVAVAGYEDWGHVRGIGRPSAWCPTGMNARPAPSRAPHDPPLVGFLGNFSHQPTVDSARYLLGCPAARAGEISIMFAGWESARYVDEFAGRAQVLGPVDDPTDLWHAVDCAVIPVLTGAGMKCKISEALLAGCPVITTPLGAGGFSPVIHPSLHVVDRLSEITTALCLEANAAGVAQGALHDLTREGASDLYASLLSDALDG